MRMVEYVRQNPAACIAYVVHVTFGRIFTWNRIFEGIYLSDTFRVAGDSWVLVRVWIF